MNPTLRWIVISQTMAVVAAGVILPFYIVYLQTAADSYSLFAYLYASFTLAAALTHAWSAKISELLTIRWMLVLGCACAGLAILAVPRLTELWQLYVVQIILGISLALQKTGEKVALAATVSKKTRAGDIGRYHAIVAVVTAVMLFLVGWSLDTFALSTVFVTMAILLIGASFASLKVRIPA